MTCEVHNEEINSQCAELLVRPLHIGPSSVFVLYLDLTSGLCRAVFPMYLVSPIGLSAY